MFRRFDFARLKSWSAFWLPLFLLANFDTLSAWNKNRYQITIQDLVLPLVVNLLTTVIITLICYRYTARQRLGAYIGAILTTLMLTQDFGNRLKTIEPFLRSVLPIPETGSLAAVVLSLVFIVVIIFAARWVGNLIAQLVKRRKWPAADIANGLTVVIAVTFVLLAYPVVRAAIVEWPQFFYRPPTLAGQATIGAAGRPDVYYIVLDRYTSQNVLRNQFSFDNTDFINYLQDHGFVTNPDAHNNYPYTTMSIAATLDANYQTDAIKKFSGAALQTIEPYHDSIRYAPVIQQFKQLGYQYDQLGSWYEASNQAPLADQSFQPEGQLTIFGHQFTLNTFPKNQLLDSVYTAFITHGLRIGGFKVLSYSSISEADATLYKLATLKSLVAEPAGGRFIFAHLLVPHDPYYFNADGSLATDPSVDNIGEPIKQKYLRQVNFINGQMKTVLDQIRSQSQGKAVVVLQSDEGPYPAQLNDEQFDGTQVEGELSTQNMLSWSDADLQMKFGNLAAYYLPGVNQTALGHGADSINIFRLIFNTYFNDNLPYLPRCYYAYTNGREQAFVYADITERLTGQANSACPKDSIFSP